MDTFSLLDHITAIAIPAFLLVGAVYVVIRRWFLPTDAPELRRPPMQVDLLPPRWRRWVLDEDEKGHPK